MGFMLITIYFFDTPQYFPKLDKVLKAVIGLGLAVIFAAFFRNVLPHGFYMKTCVLGALGIVIALTTMLIVAVWSYYLFRRKELMYFLLGFSSFLVAVIFILLTEMGFTAFRYWAHNVMPHFTLFFEFSTLLILLGYRLKEEWVNQQRKELQLLHTLSEQRNRISRDLHDDVGSTLNSIAVFSEVALQQIRLTNPHTVPVLERIGDASRHLIDTINDIVWVINPKNDQFKDTILRMRLFAADLLMPRNVAIDFFADEFLNTVNLSVDQRKHFYLIFKEIVNNAYKYAACTTLKINIECCDKDICMTIVDDGKGFDKQNPKNGNGLKSMQDRADILRGMLSVTSKLGKGTSVSLRFPIDETKNKEEKERPKWVGQEAIKSNIFVGIKLF